MLYLLFLSPLLPPSSYLLSLSQFPKDDYSGIGFVRGKQGTHTVHAREESSRMDEKKVTPFGLTQLLIRPFSLINHLEGQLARILAMTILMTLVPPLTCI